MQNALEVMKVMNYTGYMLKIPSVPLIGSVLSTFELVESFLSLDEIIEQHQNKLEENARLTREVSEVLATQRATLSGIAKSFEVAESVSTWGHLERALQDSLHRKVLWAAHHSPSAPLPGAAQMLYFGLDESATASPAAFVSGKGHGNTEHYTPPGEVAKLAALEKEVQELKQQVAVLAGLVQLRNEPAPDPLAAAKRRGSSYMKAEFDRPENLTLAAASEYAGRSDRVLNLERRNGNLYALILEGNTRGYRYPKWQFDVPAARLGPVLNLLASSAMSCWALHNFLTRPHADLAGQSPSTALGDGNFPLERILEVARRRIDLHQGAS